MQWIICYVVVHILICNLISLIAIIQAKSTRKGFLPPFIHLGMSTVFLWSTLFSGQEANYSIQKKANSAV